jgi:ClpP class serine protease
MPLYLYKHPETGEVKEILQKMNDEHKYFEEGVEWKRVLLSPNAAIDTKVLTKEQFIAKTGNMKGSVGDMMDMSSELSAERAEKSETGEDPLKRKYYDNYQKQVGKKHLSDKKKVIETDRVKIDLD